MTSFKLKRLYNLTLLSLNDDEQSMLDLFFFIGEAKISVSISLKETRISVRKIKGTI